MTIRRHMLLAVLLLFAIVAVACDRLPAPAADPGVDFGDPDVGGGAGEASGPQTPIPPATATSEASPRLDETAAAAFPTAAATASPTAGPQPPTAAPAATPEPLITAESLPTPEPSPTSAPPTPEPPTATPEVSPSPTAQTNSAGETIHVVQAGENLYRIGLQYGLSWVVIAEFNGITDPNAITVGQELRIPPLPTATPETQSAAPADARQPTAAAEQSVIDGAATAASGPSSAVVVAVSPGDTLYAIAQRHGVTWDQVAEANGLSAPNQIYAGQVLKIPANTPGPTPDFTHQVHRGETLTGIARQYGLSPAELAAANDLSEPYTIYPGQALAIPGE